MADTNWSISGEYMETCNCDYVCPCIYTNSLGDATFDDCTALLIFRIDDGSLAGVDVSGLSFALLIKSKKVMAEGDWMFGGVVDANANDEQRAALTSLVSGEIGGAPQMIRENLVSDFRGVEVAPIEFNMDGLKRSVNIPGVLNYAIEGVESVRMENGEPFYIDNVGHPAGTRLALAKASEMHINALGIECDRTDGENNGHYAPFSWAA